MESFEERLDKALMEKWTGSPEVEKRDKWGEEQISMADLKKKRDALKAKEDRTEAETSELRQINFAIRARQKDKFGKIDEELNEDGWPKSGELKKGRFTEYCKREGFDGPCKACAEKALKSDDESVRGMASYYLNTVKP